MRSVIGELAPALAFCACSIPSLLVGMDSTVQAQPVNLQTFNNLAAWDSAASSLPQMLIVPGFDFDDPTFFPMFGAPISPGLNNYGFVQIDLDTGRPPGDFEFDFPQVIIHTDGSNAVNGIFIDPFDTLTFSFTDPNSLPEELFGFFFTIQPMFPSPQPNLAVTVEGAAAASISTSSESNGFYGVVDTGGGSFNSFTFSKADPFGTSQGFVLDDLFILVEDVLFEPDPEFNLTFTGAGSTLYDEVSNWVRTFSGALPNNFPSAETNVAFNSTAGANTSISLPTSGAAARTLDIRDQTFTFSSPSAPFAPLSVGRDAGNFDGVDIVAGGELVCATNCYIKVENLNGFGVTEIASTGALTINGGIYETVEINNTAGGAITVNGGELRLGALGIDHGDGPNSQFLVTGGGAVTSEGFVEVIAADVEVADGSFVLSPSDSFVVRQGGTVLIGPNGSYTGGIGLFASTLTINGGNADFTGLFLNESPEGPSYFSVINGGDAAFSTQWLIAGESAPSTGLISGPGSTVTSLTAQVQVGSGAHGALRIESGGTLFTSGQGSPSGSSGLIGNLGAGSGVVTVTGPGSQWTQDGGLSVGFSAVGTMDVLDGGYVQSLDGFVGRNAGGNGTAAIGTNSTWEVTQTLYVGGDSAGSGGVGRLTLNGGSVVAGGGVRIWETGVLNGVGSIFGNVVNRGLVAPGFSPEIITIEGDFTQEAGGTLEIEIGGLTPGEQHDQLRVTGVATLAGRLDVPLLAPYSPAVGQGIIAITAELVTGQFDRITADDLGGVALDVIENQNDVRIQFVAPDPSIQFSRTTPGELPWEAEGNWSTGFNPDTPQVFSTVNPLVSGPQSLRVANVNAFAHEGTIGGAPGQDVAFIVESNASFINRLTATTNGTVELAGGTIAARELVLENEGMLTGSGAIIGKVMNGGGAGESMLSPGGMEAPIGAIDITGDYEQMAGGVLEIDVAADGQFDSVSVTGQATLGGVLRIDASNLMMPAPGTPFDIITAGTLTAGDIFDRVETVGNNNIYFKPFYSPASGGTPTGDGAALFINGGVSVSPFSRGDMTGDGIFDELDVQAFALALTDPLEYFAQNRIFGDQSGDVGGPFGASDGRLDFDDIDEFAALIPGASTAQVIAAIRGAQVPEPAAAYLLAACGLAVAWTRRRQNRLTISRQAARIWRG